MPQFTKDRLNVKNAGRRKFITDAAAITGATLLMQSPLHVFSTGKAGNNAPVTVGNIIDRFISEVPGGPLDKTVDTLKSGSLDMVVTGVVTTMFATLQVIRQSIAMGSNFIIAHEPTFYNHADETNWLEKDEVYRYKAALLQEHRIAVWRNHDYIHRHVPDGVMTGVLAQLGWSKQYDAANHIVTIPPASLQEIITHTKQRLGINSLRYMGDLKQSCKKVLLMPGASGGRSQIQALINQQPDTLICGEIQEWETAEYIRDAQAQGKQRSLVVLGHIASEEPGSVYMADWIKEKIPGMPVKHIPSKNSLSFA